MKKVLMILTAVLVATLMAMPASAAVIGHLTVTGDVEVDVCCFDLEADLDINGLQLVGYEGVVSDAFINESESDEDYRLRFSKIDDKAFENASGIMMPQLASGNGNVLQANTQVTVAPSWGEELANICTGAFATALNTDAEDDYCLRFDKITDQAFQNATGIMIPQLVSGNGNIVQGNVNVVVSAGAIADLWGADPCDLCQ